MSSKLAALRQKRQQLTDNIIPHVINAPDSSISNSGGIDANASEESDAMDSVNVKNEKNDGRRDGEGTRVPELKSEALGTPKSAKKARVDSPSAAKSPSSRLSQLRMKKEILSQKSTQIMSSSASAPQNPLIQHLQSQISTQKERISELEMQLESMQLERDIAVEELELLKETMSDDDDEVRGSTDTALYTQKIATLESEVSRLQSEKMQLKNAMSSSNERLDLLQNSEIMIENISNRNAQLEEKLNAYETQLNDLRELLEMSEEMESIHSNEMDMMREELQQKEDVLESMQRELRASRTALAEREQMIAKYREKLSKVEQTVSPRGEQSPAKTLLLSPMSPMTPAAGNPAEVAAKLQHSLLSARLSHQLTLAQANLLQYLLTEVNTLLPAVGDLGQQQQSLIQALKTSNTVKFMQAKMSTFVEFLIDSAANTKSSAAGSPVNQFSDDVDGAQSFSFFQHYLATFLSLLHFTLGKVQLRLENAADKEQYENQYRLVRDLLLSVDVQLNALVDRFQQQTLVESAASSILRHELFAPLRNALGADSTTTLVTFGTYQTLLDMCLQSQKRLKMHVENYENFLKRVTKLRSKSATQTTSASTTKKTPRTQPLIAPQILEVCGLQLKKLNHSLTEISQVCRKQHKHVAQFSPAVYLPHDFQNDALPSIIATLTNCLSLEEVLRHKVNTLIDIARNNSGKSAEAKAEKKALLEDQLNDMWRVLAQEEGTKRAADSAQEFYTSIFNMIESLFGTIANISTPYNIESATEYSPFQQLTDNLSSVDALNDALVKIVGLYQKDMRQFDTFREATKLQWIEDMRRSLEETPVLQEAVSQKSQLIESLQRELEQSRTHLSEMTIDKSKLEQQVLALKESAFTFSDIKQRMQSLQDMEDQIEQLTLSNKRYEKAVEELKTENFTAKQRIEELLSERESRQQDKMNLTASFDATRFYHMQRSYESLHREYLRLMNQQFTRKMSTVMAHSREHSLRSQHEEEILALQSKQRSARMRYCKLSAATTIVSLKRSEEYKEKVTERLRAKRLLRELGVGY